MPCVLVAVAACGEPAPDAVVRVQIEPALPRLSDADVAVVERYVRASSRWEVREEDGRRWAIRKEPGQGGALDASLNGFYGDPTGADRRQTRVALALGRELGFGARAAITRVPPGARSVSVGLRRDPSGQPAVWGSYCIASIAKGVTLEVFEESTRESRAFTQAALREVGAEMRAALEHRAEILAAGHAASLLPDPLHHGAPTLEIADGMQPGIYVATAWANPRADGRVLVRVRLVGPDPATPAAFPPELAGKNGTLLSDDRSGPRSVRWIGYGPDAGVLYPYQSEVTLYEGDWQHRYTARFELWFEPSGGGAARKLVETTRVVAGWMR